MTAAFPISTDVEFRHFHLFCGLGGGARGFNRGSARVGNFRARFRCIGGIDVDPGAIADFSRLAGVPGTVMDLFDRDQYVAFHGAEPPPGWRAVTPLDIQMAAGGERPHIVFLSAPCKGFSGLLSESRSGTAKYQALNKLTVRGVWLTLEAWQDDPPELVIFENVPRIATRGRRLLDQIVALLTSYGYAVAETTHDCGEIGGLAQSRKRFLLVARHKAKVPPFLYEPPKRRLGAVGDVLDKLPLPGDLTAGPMHRVPALQWRTWVRLAFVEAGKDWRSLNRLRVVDGQLQDYLIVPDMHGGALGVNEWEAPAGTVTANGRPYGGTFSVADPRWEAGRGDYRQYGVKGWDETAATVSGQSAPGGGRYTVADPRLDWSPNAHQTKYRIVPFQGPAGTVTGSVQPASGGPGVADPRLPAREARHGNQYRLVTMDDPAGTITGARSPGGVACSVADPRMPESRNRQNGIYRVVDWDGQAGAVTGATHVAGAAMSVADPRPAYVKDGRDSYQSAGMYGVVPWDGQTGAVAAAGQHDNGRWSVADPRMPEATDRGVFVIRSLDDTWHRPFTTLELAALQSLVDPEEHLELQGLSDSAWRERIGNAVPPAAAEAIASVMGRTLLLAMTGQTFILSADPIWVQPITVALSVDGAHPVEQF